MRCRMNPLFSCLPGFIESRYVNKDKRFSGKIIRRQVLPFVLAVFIQDQIILQNPNRLVINNTWNINPIGYTDEATTKLFEPHSHFNFHFAFSHADTNKGVTSTKL